MFIWQFESIEKSNDEMNEWSHFIVWLGIVGGIEAVELRNPKNACRNMSHI
jgi:hypothetical protein